MRSALAVLGIAAVLAAPAAGQISGQRQQQQPLPERWMTIDSLAAVLSLTAEQRDAIAPRLAQLNEVVKQVRDDREQLRSQMAAADQPAGREGFAAMRERMAARQTLIDEQYTAIRALLTSPQQTTFDALQKPQVMRGPGRRP